MTAKPTAQRGQPALAPLRVDLFLLAGGFPGTNHADVLADTLRYAQAAEDAGFDGVWVAEHHFISYGVCPSALAMAAFLLGRTSSLRVGTAAAILSNRHPVAVAEEAILLDELSGGRFDLGVGRGGPWVDLQVFGTGLDRFTHGFPEALDLLTMWLSGAPTVAGTGDLFRFLHVPVVPCPRRRVPVWVAATSPATVDTAATRGLPLLLGMHDGDEAKRTMLDRCADIAGPLPLAHASAHLAYIADSEADARAVLRAAMPGWLAATGQYQRIDGVPGPARDPHGYLEHLLDIHPVGTAEQCVARLVDSIAATGVRRLLLMVEGAGEPDLTLDNIARLGAEVLPHVRNASSVAYAGIRI